MAKDDSVVKSFRTTEEQFEQANEIFRKEGFNFSEVIRLLFDATIREGRIPRSLSTRDMENQLDVAKHREDYISSVLDMAIPNFDGNYSSAEERLLACIFGKEQQNASDKSNAALREWANKWGLPDNLSVATLADLYDCGFFAKDPWFGEYDYSIDYDAGVADAAVIHKFEENLKDNISQIARRMRIKAVKTLMEYDKMEDKEYDD